MYYVGNFNFKTPLETASMHVTLVFGCFNLSLLTTTTAACQPATTTTTTTTTRPENNRECWRWGKEMEMGGPPPQGTVFL